MIKQIATPSNGNGTHVPNRLAMNRLGPQKSFTSQSTNSSTVPDGRGDDLAQNRLNAKKMADELAKVATKLPALTKQFKDAGADAGGPAHLVARESEEIAAQRLHVDLAMGRRLRRVDNGDCPLLVRKSDQLLDRNDRPERVRDGGDGNDPQPATARE